LSPEPEASRPSGNAHSAGFNVKLLLLPLVGQDIVIRKVKADTAAQPSENADQLHDETPY
jgi:hypothetical protein